MKSVLVAIVVITFSLVSLQAFAGGLGLDPSNYVLMHLFAAAEDAGARGGAMGKIMSVLPGPDAANPALMEPGTKGSDFLVKQGSYSLGDIDKTDIKTTQIRYLKQLDVDRVIAVNYYGADTGLQSTSIPGLEKRFQENDVAVAYRKRIGHLSVGAAAAVLPVNMEFRLPDGSTVARIKSNVCYGLMPGIAYQRDKVTLGIVSQLYTEKSTLSTAAGSATNNYRTANNFIGASYKLTENDLVAVEWEKGRISGGGISMPISTLKAGVEHARGSLAVRAGLMDGELTFGLGYNHGSLKIDFAYLAGPHKDQLDALGGARANLFALSYSF